MAVDARNLDTLVPPSVTQAGQGRAKQVALRCSPGSYVANQGETSNTVLAAANKTPCFQLPL